MAAGIEGNLSHFGSDDLEALFPPSFSSWKGGALSCEAGFPIKADAKSFFSFCIHLAFVKQRPRKETVKVGRNVTKQQTVALEEWSRLRLIQKGFISLNAIVTPPDSGDIQGILQEPHIPQSTEGITAGSGGADRSEPWVQFEQELSSRSSCSGLMIYSSKAFHGLLLVESVKSELQKYCYSAVGLPSTTRVVPLRCST